MRQIAFEFLKPGLQTTIQDAGRFGYQHFGLPVSGAMDQMSFRQANELVSNPPDTPVFEIALLGPTIKIKGPCQIAITGANLSPKINSEPIAMYETINVEDGDLLSFGRLLNGCRAYLAVRGKWLLNKWLGSYSALAIPNLAVTVDQVIKKGSRIDFEGTNIIEKKRLDKKHWPKPNEIINISVYPGPEFDLFTNHHIAFFFSRIFNIDSQSNRMGYRLNDPIPNYKITKELISSAVFPGTIQITNTGQPIILMRDAQTTGGYYRIACVGASDINLLAQLKPGNKIRFIFQTN